MNMSGKSRFGDNKTHFKSYKSGKRWVVMGITLFSVGLGLQMLPTNGMAAQDTTPEASKQEVSQLADTPANADGTVADDQSNGETTPQAETNGAGVVADSPTPAKEATVNAPSATQPANETKSATPAAEQQPLTRAQDATKSTTAKVTAAPVTEAAQAESDIDPKTGKTVVTKDNFDKYFQNQGDALYDQGKNTVELTDNESQKHESGNVAFNQQINMNQSFTLKGKIDLGDKTMQNGGGDGISVGFHTGDTNQVGTAGLSGLPGAFGWKADTYWNKDADTIAGADPQRFGNKKQNTIFGFPVGKPYYDEGDGNSFGAFVTTDAKDVVTVYDGTDAPAQAIEGPTSRYQDITVEYDGTTKRMTINYEGKTWSRDVSDWITSDTMTFLIAASTGGATNAQRFQLDSFDYYRVATVNVRYVDQQGNVIAEGSVDYPDGQYKSKAYTTTQLDIPNYEFQNMDSQSAVANGTLADWGDNGTVTYVYRGVTKSATVNYFDETTQQVITSDTLSGEYNRPSDYSTEGQLADLTSKGYELVSDGFLAGYVFDATVNPVFTVTLKHGLKTTQETKTVKRTINYVYADGQSAAQAVEQAVNFERTLTTDQVTMVTTPSEWVAADGTKLAAVDSPAIVGYHADQTQVAAQNDVTADDADQVITVTYAADDEKATITYTDDTTGKQLSIADLSGKYDQVINYDIATQLANLAKKGYRLVSNDFEADQEHYDTTVQQFNVHVVHTTTPKDEVASVQRTINYVYPDGKPVQPSVTQTLTYKRVATTDNVTGVVTNSAWQADNGTTLAAVASPVMTGYTADQTTVAAQTEVTPDTQVDNVTVTYAPNTESATVNFVDDTLGKTIQRADLTGLFGETETYRPNHEINAFEAAGYQLVGTDFPMDAGWTYDTTAPVFTVHLIHTQQVATEGKQVNRTIHYVYADGTQAQPDAVATLNFSRDVTTDNVTGQVLKTDWAPTNGTTFARVDTPMIVGYTPDQANVAARTLVQGTDADETRTVTYNADTEAVTVNFIDDVTGKTIKVQPLSGAYGTTDAYRATDQIATFEAAGYQLVSNDYPENGVRYDQTTPRTFNVHLTHSLTVTTEEPTVKRTINYVYANGQPAQTSVVQTLDFTRQVTTDNVTGQVVKDAWIPVTTTVFDAVTTPTIKGYTADQATVDAFADVDGDTANATVTVTYTADAPVTTPTDTTDTTTTQPTTKPVTEPDHVQGHAADQQPTTSTDQVPTAKGEPTTAATKPQTTMPSTKQVAPVAASATLAPVTDHQPAASRQTAKALPQTGEQQDQAGAAWGVALLTLTSLLGSLIITKKPR